MRHRKIRTRVSWLVGALCWLGLFVDHASANSGITIEAVDAYPACGTLSNNAANVNNFRSRMLSISGFSTGATWFDGLVWSTDFTDPEIVSGGADQFNFDRPSDAISYFSGHGSCNDQTNTACSPGSTCPAVSGGFASVCTRFGENPLTGRCMYARPRTLVTQKSGTNSCQFVDYSSGQVRWGESNGFSWAGAGTNGNVNLAVIDNSCGLTPDLWFSELLNPFAGVSTIAIIMPTRFGSDTADVANRGRAFADRYVANSLSAVAPAWADSINSVSGGSSCAFGGGNHGIVGCGANIALSSDSNQNGALWGNRTETWSQLRNEANDANGNSWLAWIYTCNYDCNAHPWGI